MFEDANKKEKDIHQNYDTQKEERIKIRDSILSVVDVNDVKKCEFYLNATMSWLDTYEDGCYLGCYVNKLGDVVVALHHGHVIYLLGESYRTIMYAPKLMFHMIQSDYIHIDDVLVKHNSVGNGTIVMTALLLYAQQHGIRRVTGFLSSADDDHKIRRDSYYAKFGFSIQNNHIVKEL